MISKKRFKFLLIVLCLLIFSWFYLTLPLQAAPQKTRRPMTVDDALNMIRVGNVLISPDGHWVFFSKSELNWEKNRRDTKYYLISAEGGEEFQYIGREGGSSFQYSPDGKYLSFKRSVDKKSQLFLMRTSGGEAIQATKHKTSVGFYRWSPRSDKIFFIADRPRSPEEEKKYKAGEDVIFVDEGPNGQREGRWKQIWVFDLKTKKETLLLDKELIINELDISPDGKQVLFTARETNRRNDGYKNEIYLLDVTTKKITRLTQNKAPESSPLWAPNGQVFVYLAADDKEWLNRNSKIWLMDPKTRQYELLSANFEGSIRGLFWTPDSQYIYFNGQQGVNTNLFRLHVPSKKIEKITDIQGTLRVTGFSRDHSRYVYIFSDYDTPPDVYTSTVSAFKPIRLTRLNPWVEEEIELATMKLIRWKSVKDFEIEGLLHLPANYKKGTRLPLILHIHGGPAGCFTNSFRASYHIWAGLGYASLSPNVRGSSGYTDHLREGNTVQQGDGIGKGDYWDLMYGVDKVIAEGYVDPNQLGLRGWSYGGILGGWTITQTNRFKAASIGAGVYDWSSEYGMGFNHDVRLWHIGGTPWDNPQAYRAQSAYTYVKNVTTPTLLIHGMKDTTDTEGQSLLFFTALKDIGKAPCRYLRVPREPHGFREPRHQRIRDIEEIKWMQKYVRGIDLTPWERKEDKKKEEDQEKK